jgi:hypothetical protein
LHDRRISPTGVPGSWHPSSLSLGRSAALTLVTIADIDSRAMAPAGRNTHPYESAGVRASPSWLSCSRSPALPNGHPSDSDRQQLKLQVPLTRPAAFEEDDTTSTAEVVPRIRNARIQLQLLIGLLGGLICSSPAAPSPGLPAGGRSSANLNRVMIRNSAPKGLTPTSSSGN